MSGFSKRRSFCFTIHTADDSDSSVTTMGTVPSSLDTASLFVAKLHRNGARSWPKNSKQLFASGWLANRLLTFQAGSYTRSFTHGSVFVYQRQYLPFHWIRMISCLKRGNHRNSNPLYTGRMLSPEAQSHWRWSTEVYNASRTSLLHVCWCHINS